MSGGDMMIVSIERRSVSARGERPGALRGLCRLLAGRLWFEGVVGGDGAVDFEGAVGRDVEGAGGKGRLANDLLGADNRR